ncbi:MULTISPECIES: iron ABC transporter permease [Gammaproteobacteria]|uniref:ABC transporter permease n=1 Tax=Gammaproteobacteria TaxID=1236 RepID=UPI000DD06A7B|nr:MULTISPECIES: iron ABC transporter permease [Gammaproteobacteria]RTE87726.1 iron ABC transporter permease [Aliidiomarina sp. B3213]TCZ92492.1 iron ABC transporter permease [Lysobacter sp. N42]
MSPARSSAYLLHKSLRERAFSAFRKASSPLLATFVCLPLLVVIAAFFIGLTGEEQRQTLSHLWEFVIAEYVWHTIVMMVGVGVLVTLLGVSTAWLTTACEFKGVRWLRWALLLPLAMPAYITAYTYSGMLSYEGIVQRTLRDIFNWSYGDYYFPEVRSITGAILVLSFVLFPYVYLITRAAFLEQSRAAIEASRVLGLSPWKSFWRVALPMARPAIATGLTLALMETLADYGTVHFYGVTTFTTGIFRTWYGMGDPLGALQLSSILLSAIIILMVLERISRKQSQYHNGTKGSQPARPFKLSRGKSIAAFLVCFIPIAIGFVFPALQLISWSYDQVETWLSPDFHELVKNSIALALLASSITVMVALWFCYGKRQLKTTWTRISVNLASTGYAVPGVIVAVGIIVPFAWFDRQIISASEFLFGINPGLIFSGTIISVLFAYLVRFLSVSIQTIDSGLAQISPAMDESGRILGLSSTQVLGRIHFPLLKTSLMTAGILVFVDVLKELPATLILRPFNFNTLAVRAYEMAGDERLAQAGPAALMIVVAGLVPVILLSRAIQARHQSYLNMKTPPQKAEEIYEPVNA